MRRIGFFIGGLLLGIGTVNAATVSGRVVDSASQQPIAGAHLTVVSTFAGFPAYGPSADTDADGRYAFTFSDNGTQYLGIVAEAAGHAARAHNGTACSTYASCAPGVQELVVETTSTYTVDFALPPEARLSGRVIDATTSAAISGAYIEAHGTGDIDSALFHIVQSDTDGYFTVARAHAGHYVLRAREGSATTGELRHLQYAWPDLHCDNVHQPCSTLPATPIVLTSGASAGAFEVRLKRGSMIRVRMLSTENDTTVRQTTTVATPSSTARLSGATAADGYAYVGPLLPGEIALALEPSSPTAYPAIIHPNRPCASLPCDLTDAPTLDVPDATLVSASDVLVAPLRTIRGHVTDANGVPRGGIRVSAGDVRFGVMAPSGFAREATTLSTPDGSYELEGFFNPRLVVRTQAAVDNWIDVAWPDTVCGGANLFCDDEISTYTRVDLDAAPHAAGIDLIVRPGSTLQGKVVDTVGTPKPSWYVALIPNGASRPAAPVMTDTEGRFRLSGLTGDTFHVWAGASAPRQRADGTLYPNVECTLDYWTAPIPCDLSAATPLTPSGNGIDGLVITVPLPDALFADTFD